MTDELRITGKIREIQPKVDEEILDAILMIKTAGHTPTAIIIPPCDDLIPEGANQVYGLLVKHMNLRNPDGTTPSSVLFEVEP